MERNSSNIIGMSLKGEKRIRVGGLDIVELDGMMARGSQETLVGRYAQTIDLGVRMLNSAGADSRQGLPESISSAMLAA